MTLKHILSLLLRNVHCAQVVLQIKLNYYYFFISVSLKRYVSKHVNRFKIYVLWNKCILNILLFFTRVFMFNRRKKVSQAWNNMRASNWWNYFHFWLNYPFKENVFRGRLHNTCSCIFNSLTTFNLTCHDGILGARHDATAKDHSIWMCNCSGAALMCLLKMLLAR